MTCLKNLELVGQLCGKSLLHIIKPERGSMCEINFPFEEMHVNSRAPRHAYKFHNVEKNAS